MDQVVASPDINIGSWFLRGWSTYKKNPKQLIIGTVILAAIGLVVTLINAVPVGFFISLPVQLLVTPVLMVGWMFLCLRSVRGEEAKGSDVFSGFSRFGTSLAVVYLVGLIIIGGIILLIVPGIIWSIKYGQAYYSIMDKKLSARESLRFSGKITKGYKGKIFIVGLAGLVLSLLSWPFYLGLQNLLKDGSGAILLAIGFIPYLVAILVISPWLGATGAAIYDSLVSIENKKSGIE